MGNGLAQVRSSTGKRPERTGVENCVCGHWLFCRFVLGHDDILWFCGKQLVCPGHYFAFSQKLVAVLLFDHPVFPFGCGPMWWCAALPHILIFLCPVPSLQQHSRQLSGQTFIHFTAREMDSLIPNESPNEFLPCVSC